METLKHLLKNPWVQGAIGIIAFLIVVPLLLSKVFEVSFGSIGKMFGIKTDAEKKAEEDAINAVTGAGIRLGFPADEMANLEQKAYTIANHLGTNAWWDWTQDEDKALNELVGLNRDQYQLIAQYYSNKYDRNLTNDLKEYCTTEQLVPYANIIN